MHTTTLHTPKNHPTLRFGASLITGALLACGAMSAFAENPLKTPAEIQTRYEHDRAKCLSGQSNQDQATCLREAGAARDEAKKGQLTEDGTNFRKNAKTRCDALSGDEQRDCIARMRGAGTVSGSVESGGVLRETVTREVQPVQPAASAVAAP